VAAGNRASARANFSSHSDSPMPATGSFGPTPAACAGGSTSRLHSSPGRLLAVRSVKRIPRQPDLLVGFTIQPVMFTLLFVNVYSVVRSRRQPQL
jgi:hypothetical protein